MNNKMTENNYLDKLDSIEIAGAVKVAIEDVIDCLDSHIMALEPAERVAVGTCLTFMIGGTTLANALKDRRHLLPAAVESMAEEIATRAESILTAYDNGAFTRH